MAQLSKFVGCGNGRLGVFAHIGIVKDESDILNGLQIKPCPFAATSHCSANGQVLDRYNYYKSPYQQPQNYKNAAAIMILHGLALQLDVLELHNEKQQLFVDFMIGNVKVCICILALWCF